MRKTVDISLLGRGVWQAPWLGPEGEMVLVAITSQQRILGEPVTVEHGSSRIAAAESLLARLELADPAQAAPWLRIV